MKWLFTQQDPDLVMGVSVVQDRERPGQKMKNDHLTNLQTVIDKLALKMIGKPNTSKHPVFKCSNMLQTGALKRRKKGGEVV